MSTATENPPTCSCATGATLPGEPRIEERPIDEIVRFHGHMCAGLAMGIRASEVALREIGPHSADEEVVALVETSMCAVDAIQYMTGCTFGKGNLIHLDHGKNAYTFIRRSDGKAIRIATRPGVFGNETERMELFDRVRAGEATAEERARFGELQLARSQQIIDTPEGDLHTVEELDEVEIPPMARIHQSVNCAECGEPTMEPSVRRLGGRELCQTCFDAALVS